MTDSDKFPLTTRNKYILIISSLTIVNIVGYNYTFYLGANLLEHISTSLFFYVIDFPVLGLLIGLLVALIKYKQLEYKDKYLRAFLLSLLALNILSVFILMFTNITVAIGNYRNKTNTTTATNDSTKDAFLTSFRGDIQSYCDSSVYYLDYAKSEIDAGQDVGEMSVKISPKVRHFEELIDRRLKQFGEEAKNAGITTYEYELVMRNIEPIAKPMIDKLDELKTKGFELK